MSNAQELASQMLEKLRSKHFLERGCETLRSAKQSIMVIEQSMDDEKLAWASIGLMSELARINVPVRYVRPNWRQILQAYDNPVAEMRRQLGRAKNPEELPELSVVPVLLGDIARAFDKVPTTSEISVIVAALNVGHDLSNADDSLKVVPLYVIPLILYSSLKGKGNFDLNI